MSIIFRQKVFKRLYEDLVGPRNENEIFSDRPTQRYSTGILYPPETQIEPEEDIDGDNAGGEDDDDVVSASHDGVSLASTLKPSTAGISFALKKTNSEVKNKLKVQVKCACYQVFYVDENGIESTSVTNTRKNERWRRIPKQTTLSIPIMPGRQNLSLEPEIPGMELYVLMREASNLLTTTLALVNRNPRGESRVFDEAQHFFQTEMKVIEFTGHEIAPRPTKRSKGDEDGRVSQLIYRDVKEYVVGHTCSAGFEANEEGLITAVKTEWIPYIEVPRMDDKGDEVFWSLKSRNDQSILNSNFLSSCSATELEKSLSLLVEKYIKWIELESKRIDSLPEHLQPQALDNMKRCSTGADRMREGISLIANDQKIRTAFQISQSVMNEQFGWSNKNKELIWRPFQLAFQLLSLASLSDRNHSDRNLMDLLWFPTGGGKTEAYLAQTAFIIVLRRLRATDNEDGSGVCAFMRYTLRLLTIQQFQRAAAMIFACEAVRKNGVFNGSRIDLGKAPIGIGLWVGEAATPTTLEAAIDRNNFSTSRAEQLKKCPCCQQELSWTITRVESSVRCINRNCSLAKSLSTYPIWTIDQEIYEKTPSLIIGTVDKFAQIVRKPETGKLFGKGNNKSPPDLIIQDELHLISGPLGTVSGIYEVAIDELCRNNGQRAKIIGSTATIRRAYEQAKALFDRDTFQFPSPGIDHTNSGFAKSDNQKPGRLYLGLTTAGRSATYMLQAIASSLLQSSQDPTLSETERDYYWTLVIYFNSLRELGRALVLMQDDVPVSINQIAAQRSESARTIDAPSELTSRVSSKDIGDMLEILKKKSSDTDSVNLLLASNMISVGMDIPRLAIMLVNAQPKTLSEYIQATSRVGRSEVPGLVITMYNNSRARDRSRFETFNTWHRCLYRDIEATSVTPFASRAQDKALHAVLVALARHLIPSLQTSPRLNVQQKSELEAISLIIEERVARVDNAELAGVSSKLKHLIDEWHNRQDLQAYWDDYGKRISLLMSAEQHAAKKNSHGEEEQETPTNRAWATPNSMREVEASTPFILKKYIQVRTEGENE